MEKVIFEIKRPDGRLEQVDQTNKFSAWNDILHDQAKSSWAKHKDKGELIRVIYYQYDLKPNPAYKMFNDSMNEGEEGYNPHAKFINNGLKEVIFN